MDTIKAETFADGRSRSRDNAELIVAKCQCPFVIILSWKCKERNIFGVCWSSSKMETAFLLEKTALFWELGIRVRDDAFQSLKPTKMNDPVDHQVNLS